MTCPHIRRQTPQLIVARACSTEPISSLNSRRIMVARCLSKSLAKLHPRMVAVGMSPLRVGRKGTRNSDEDDLVLDVEIE